MPFKDKEKSLAHARMRYAARRDEIRTNRSKWRKENKEKIKAYRQRYFDKNKPSILEKSKKYRDENKKACADRVKAWWAKHPDKTKQYNDSRREYRQNYYYTIVVGDREKYRARHRKWKRNNRDKVAEQTSRRRARVRSLKTDSTAVDFYTFVRGQKLIPCYYCGTKVTGKKAHIDHVISVAKMGNHTSSNLCASCATCNLRKNSRLPSELHFTDQPLLNL